MKILSDVFKIEASYDELCEILDALMLKFEKDFSEIKGPGIPVSFDKASCRILDLGVILGKKEVVQDFFERIEKIRKENERSYTSGKDS